MKIGNKTIGERTYIIAEAGVNHNGSLDRAKQLVDAAVWAGADAIKFQTYTADELVVKGTPKFWNAEVDKDKADQHEAYKSLEGFKREWYPELFDYCEKKGIEFLSTAFSFEAADFLDSIGMRAFKVASSDMSTLPYLAHIARYKKPIILSTGASTMEEIRESLEVIEEEDNDNIIILHCTLKYPTPYEHANLQLIHTLSLEYPWYPVGISDHTLGSFSSIVACAFGAEVIEKHFTIDKSLPDSADHWLSVDPQELKEIVEGCRKVEQLRGHHEKLVFTAEQETRMYDKRSIVSAVDIPRDATITREMLTFKRPGTGIWPRELNRVIGRRARNVIKRDTTLQWEHFHQH